MYRSGLIDLNQNEKDFLNTIYLEIEKLFENLNPSYHIFRDVLDLEKTNYDVDDDILYSLRETDYLKKFRYDINYVRCIYNGKFDFWKNYVFIKPPIYKSIFEILIKNDIKSDIICDVMSDIIEKILYKFYNKLLSVSVVYVYFKN